VGGGTGKGDERVRRMKGKGTRRGREGEEKESEGKEGEEKRNWKQKGTIKENGRRRNGEEGRRKKKGEEGWEGVGQE
jgi:hypothetical protein